VEQALGAAGRRDVGASDDAPGGGKPAGWRAGPTGVPAGIQRTKAEGSSVPRIAGGPAGGVVGEWAGLPGALPAKGVGGPTCALSRQASLRSACGSSADRWAALTAERRITMKRLLLVFLLVNLVLAACAPASAPAPTAAPTFTATPLPTSTSTPTPTPIPTPTPEPTPTPTPEPGVISQPDGSFVVITETGERLTVPQIPGLTQQVEEVNGVKTVVFYAEKGNPYGLKEGAYAGEFKPDLSVNSYVGTCDEYGRSYSSQYREESNIKTTGVLVLAPNVVKYQIEQQLAQIPEGQPRLLFPLPIDPREVSNLELRVVDHQFPDVTIRELHIMWSPLSEDGLPVVNVIPDTNVIRAQYAPRLKRHVLYDLRTLDSRYLSRITSGKEMWYITIDTLLTGAPRENHTIENVPFGEKLGTTKNSSIWVFVSAADEHIDMDLKYLYMIDGVPVAIATNQ